MAEFESIYAKSYRDGKVYSKDEWLTTAARVTMYAGRIWSNSNWVLCLKITIPKPAKSLTLSFCQAEGGPYSGDASVSKKKAKLRYKFTDTEESSLLNATSDIPGDGSFELNLGNYVRTTVTIDKTLAAGTHYMYIWEDESDLDYNVLYTRWYDGNYGFYGSYEELVGASRMKDANGVNLYHAYIKTDNGAKMYAPYVFNGSTWVAMG